MGVSTSACAAADVSAGLAWTSNGVLSAAAITPVAIAAGVTPCGNTVGSVASKRLVGLLLFRKHPLQAQSPLHLGAMPSAHGTHSRAHGIRASGIFFPHREQIPYSPFFSRASACSISDRVRRSRSIVVGLALDQNSFAVLLKPGSYLLTLGGQQLFDL
jgi:hypothetical protein